jgi:hypothetical protein
MISSNFSLYFDSLLMINRGEGIEAFSEDVVENLEKWEYIVVLDGEIIITQKGLNVLEFYLRNKEFMSSCTKEMQETLIQTYSQ